jgi:glycosyltransferase involved in cell wall biosynthesis
MKTHELTIGVTAWNSAPFLGACLESIRMTIGRRARIIVHDNLSTDGSDALAERAGAEVVREHCTQAAALNRLFAMSKSPYTLLMHADVVMLHMNWFDICLRRFDDDVALVCPEDNGCGPYTRFWGTGKPDCSFMLLDSSKARAARTWASIQRFKINWPRRALDLGGEHVAYNLPGPLGRVGYRVALMDVHPSSADLQPPFELSFAPKYWREGFESLRYGLGNFCGSNGEITHYHNWYDRSGAPGAEIALGSDAQYPPEGGFPLAWLQACSRRFLGDWEAGAVRLPVIAESRGARERARAWQ